MLNFKSRFQPEKPIVGLETLKKLVFQIGTISKVSLIAKAKKPSFEMDADFGSNSKKSCGQFVRNYKIEELMNKQVFALTNLSPVRIAGIKSEYLTLGFPDEKNDGQAIGISPQNFVPNGAFELIRHLENSVLKDSACSSETAKYEDFESLEIKSGTIIDIVRDFEGNKMFSLIDLGNETYTFSYIGGNLIEDKKFYIGIQVPVITNVELPFLTDFFDFKSMLICVPLDDKNGTITLLKIDKPVKNGLNIF